MRRIAIVGGIVITGAVLYWIIQPAAPRGPSVKGRRAAEWQARLTEPDIKDRCEAADALGRLGTAARPAIPQLLELLGDDDPLVRANASVALGRIGPAAVPGLIQSLNVSKIQTRRAAAQALAIAGAAAQTALPALVAALNDPDIA